MTNRILGPLADRFILAVAAAVWLTSAVGAAMAQEPDTPLHRQLRPNGCDHRCGASAESQGGGERHYGGLGRSGGWYIGGGFWAVKGQPRNKLAHIHASGALTDWDPGLTWGGIGGPSGIASGTPASATATLQANDAFSRFGLAIRLSQDGRATTAGFVVVR